ncbi:methyl-accepting chemotaxis protein [Planctomycetota bacterium]|nr:methyl-accepting chemotaxis protein [Planctomycetota bacterium]
MKIGHKLMISFMGVAGLCTFIGGIGYYGLSKTTTSIKEINDTRLPSVVSLQQLEAGATLLSSELNSLMDTKMSDQDRQAVYAKIPKIRQSITSAWEIYEPLPQTPEESEMWKRFVPMWGEWRDANNQFVDIIKRFDVMDLGDPQVLREHMEQFRGDHYELGSKLYVMMRTGEDVHGGEDATQCSLGKWLQDANMDNPQFARLIESIHPYHNAYHGAVTELKSAVKQGQKEHAEEIYKDQIIDNSQKLCGVLAKMRTMAMDGQGVVAEAKNQFETVNKAISKDTVGLLHEILELNTDVAKQAAGDGTKAASRATMITAIAVMIGIVIAIALGIIIRRLLVRPIDAMVERLKDIAEGEGDLTQRVDQNRKDEIGDLGLWFNTFINKIHDTISDVAKATDEVSGAATEIAASSEQIASRMVEQTSKATEISSAVEEMSSSVQDVSGRAAEAAKNSVEAGKQAEHGGEVVNRTISGMDTIAHIVNDSAKSIETLGEKSEQIGQVIDVINDIADQTNLLALNAAIEAARAGEHGRGFAVVADEVRKLADRTTKATEEIAGSINGIQTETRGAVEQMTSGTESVQEGVSLANEAGNALSNILEGSKEVEGMVQSIAAASEEQSAAAEEIATHINTIRSGTEESSEGAKQTAQAANQMSINADQLKRLVAQFKLAG